VWHNGYTSEISYTHGYYQYMTPTRMSFLFAVSGLEYSDVETAYEAGYGQGLTINLNASSTAVRWSGCDFLPEHTLNAQRLRDFSGSKVDLTNDSFADLSSGDASQDLDFIALHGIWSWVGDLERSQLKEFINSRLKTGGILYLGYNVDVGFAPLRPLRHIMKEFERRTKGIGNTKPNVVRKAIEFVDKTLKLKPKYLLQNESILKRFEKIKEHDIEYLAHEYFNENWKPTTFADLAREFEELKLSFACPAQAAQHVPAINLTQDQIAHLSEIDDSILKETVRDLFTSANFRADYWVRGVCKLSLREREEIIKQFCFTLTAPSKDFKFEIDGDLGKATLKEELYQRLLGFFESRDFVPVTALITVFTEVNFESIVQALLILSHKGTIAPIYQLSPEDRCVEESINLNKSIVARNSIARTGIEYLASPVLGSGFHVPHYKQLLIHGFSCGNQDSDTLVLYLTAKMEEQKLELSATEGSVTESSLLIKSLVDDFLSFDVKLFQRIKLL